MSTCRGKVKHDLYRDAEKQLRRLKKFGKYPGGYRGEVYTCPVCNFLHVGRPPRVVRQDRKREVKGV